MIPEYLSKRNAAACLCLGCMVSATWLNYRQQYRLAELTSIPTVLLLIAACWFYLKAKKRSGAWLLLLPLGMFTFLIYWALEDRSDEADNLPCPACTAANFPTDEVCRLCKSPLRPPEATSLG